MNTLYETRNPYLDKACGEPFSLALYNSLEPVMVADQALHARADQPDFFKAVGNLICEHDLQAHVGLCLLHRHNRVAPGHFMCEYLDPKTYGAEALVMEHVELDAAAGTYAPVALKVTDAETIAALEFSTVDVALTNYRALARVAETFLPQFCQLVIDHDFQDLVGLSVLRLDALGPKDDEILLEHTETRSIANVLMVAANADTSRHIQTIWQFKQVWFGPDGSVAEAEGDSGTRSADEPDVVSRCTQECEVTNYCKSWCPRDDDGLHLGRSHDLIIHSREHEL